MSTQIPCPVCGTTCEYEDDGGGISIHTEMSEPLKGSAPINCPKCGRFALELGLFRTMKSRSFSEAQKKLIQERIITAKGKYDRIPVVTTHVASTREISKREVISINADDMNYETENSSEK